MNARNISWEIVLAGIAFMGIGIYLLSQYSPDNSGSKDIEKFKTDFSLPNPPSLPGALVIDLSNLENLEDLSELKNLENLEELKKLGRVFKNKINSENREELKAQMEKLKNNLQGIDQADYTVKLQDRKIFINKDYNTPEAEWAEAGPGVFVFRESFSTENLRSLKFDTPFGNVNIVGSKNAEGEITLRATGNIDSSEFLATKMNFIRNLASPEAEFLVKSADKSHLSTLINLEATISLPSNTKLDIVTSGGHINAQNLNNKQLFKTSGGHITLDGISGETSAETKGGHITTNRISGETQLTTGGGHIKVQEINGLLTAQTGGGHIQISDAQGTITGKTSGGNISASVKEANGPLIFSTSAGNISLSIPETLGANLDITGSAINLAQIFEFSGDKGRGSITGAINGGGVPIVIDCDYGTVNIDPIN